MPKNVIRTAATTLLLCGSAMAQTAEESRALTADLLADAASRASALAAAPAPVTIGGALQFRYNINSRDNVPGNEDLATGFQTRLSTLWVTGEVAPGFTYRVQGNFDIDGGTFTLEDAYFLHALGDGGWFIGAGQLYFPVLWEDYVDKWRQLGADYSPTNAAFRPDRVQGAFVHYSSESFRFWGAIDDGAGTANSDYTSMAEADYALTARGEWKFAGQWDRFADFTSFKGSDYAGKLGGAAHWQSGGETFATGDMDIFLGTIDVCVEGSGWNAFAAGIYRMIDPSVGNSLDDFGFVLQGGIFVADQWELFGRYDISIPDDNDRPGDFSAFSTVTFGVNHYISPESQSAKLTLDILYSPDKQSESITPSSTITGILADSEGDQFNFRVQMQLIF
ncbi:MAG: hypothetical protein JNM80_14535 [Phycisphaerae bacterium]|nr:hypothetical protein [Phycisphaerae bacterium]